MSSAAAGGRGKSGSRRLQDIRPPPTEPFALMAAAQMHGEGRLMPISDHTDFRQSDNIDDRRDESGLAVKLKNLLAGDDAMSPSETRRWAAEQPKDFTNPLAKGLGLRDLYKGND